MSFITRFQLLLNDLKKGPSELADHIQINRSMVSHVLKGRNKPGTDFVRKLQDAYPDLNMDWLFDGTGSMWKDPGTLYAPSNKLPENDSVPGSQIHHTENTAVYGTQKPIQSRTGTKKLKRVILLFDDGSFETYEAG